MAQRACFLSPNVDQLVELIFFNPLSMLKFKRTKPISLMFVYQNPSQAQVTSNIILISKVRVPFDFKSTKVVESVKSCTGTCKPERTWSSFIFSFRPNITQVPQRNKLNAHRGTGHTTYFVRLVAHWKQGIRLVGDKYYVFTIRSKVSVSGKRFTGETN